VTFLTKLAQSSRARDSIICIGLDPEPDLIPEVLGSGPQAALRFLRRVIRATSDYACAYKPNLAFYFKVPIEVSLRRILNGRISPKFHEAGMDLGLSDDASESFKLFQSKILEEYDQIAREFNLTVIDGTAPIQRQQQQIREIVRKELKNYRPMPYLQKKENVYVR